MERFCSGKVARLGAEAEAVLFAAARADHVEKLIRPALARGDWVLCDRFFDSTHAYQGAMGGVDEETLDILDRVAVGETLPELTIILDVPPEMALGRVAARLATNGGQPDRFERDVLDLHAKRREAFLAIAGRDPERCVVVDADPSRRRGGRGRLARRLRTVPGKGRLSDGSGGRQGDRAASTRSRDGRAPEERFEWYGDPAAETVLLDAYRDGRMHHAWLIGGPKGIGKATLAYRFARFVFAHPDPKAAAVRAATDLSLPADHPAFRRVAARAHPNLLALRAARGTRRPSATAPS